MLPAVGGILTSPLDAEYLAVEESFSQRPSGVWRQAASDYFVNARAALNVAALGQAFDWMYLLCHENEEDALINVANPGTFDAVEFIGLGFTANQGFTGNGAGYLHTGFTPSANGVAYQQNSASLGVYVRTDVPNSARVDIGARHSVSSRQAWILSRANDNPSENFTTNVLNQNSIAISPVGSVPDGRGLFVTSRTASNLVRAFRNGVQLQSNTNGSSTRPAHPILVFCINENGTPALFSTRQIALAFAGRGMTNTQVANFYNAVQAFMTAIGAQV